MDPDALLLGVALEDDHVGPFVLVITERDFKRFANRSHARGKPTLAAQVSLVPGRKSRWAEYVFSREQLPDALLYGIEPKYKVSPPPRIRGAIARATGFRGEMEVTRRLADVDDLTIFRAFPDLETAEVVVLHEKSRQVVGIQVKTIGVDRQHREGTIDVDVASFRPSATTWVVGVAWDRDSRLFRDECLVIPSLDVDRIVAPYRGHLRFPFFPDSPRKWGRLTPYRRPLADLGKLMAAELLPPSLSDGTGASE